MNSNHYSIRCCFCDWSTTDDGIITMCPHDHKPSLLRAKYELKKLQIESNQFGVFRYQHWLPILRTFPLPQRSVVYHAETLGHRLGLTQLFIAFSGYWPERYANLETCTFKELEALVAVARLPNNFNRILIIPSAGNAALAFASICSQLRINALIIVPEYALPNLKLRFPLNSCVKCVALKDSLDYQDAIELSRLLTKEKRFFFERGVYNIARREAASTILLEFVEQSYTLPDFYIQGVGSGLGPIAFYHRAQDLLATGSYDTPIPKIVIGQNIPATSIVDAWKNRQPLVHSINREEARFNVTQVMAQVLANPNPAYSIAGGLYDVLVHTNGLAVAISNKQVQYALDLFQQVEGIDIEPASAVAIASVIELKKSNEIHKDASILLHITGGGRQRFSHDYNPCPITPDLFIQSKDLIENLSDVLTRIEHLF